MTFFSNFDSKMTARGALEIIDFFIVFHFINLESKLQK
jgi:hypothetical protein